jgi:hypothetical protein
MKEKDQAQLEAFLGFPLLGWLMGMPLPALARLCVFLFRQKSANWAMIRTLTNVLECTPEFRQLLPEELRTDFTAVEVSIRKSGREALLWLYAVAYLFLRNVRDLVGRESAAVGKHPVLEPVRTREYQLLQSRLGDDCFGNTLKALRADHRQAYHCWTRVGSQTAALALHGLGDAACRSLLGGAVSEKFLEDIFQLRQGAFLAFTPFAVIRARDLLVTHYAEGLVPAVVHPDACLSGLLALDKAWLHRCLYNANLVDVGVTLGRQPDPQRLLDSLQPRLHPLYFLLLEAAGKGELKINRTDPEALRKLLVEVRLAGLHRKPSAT